jgi:hypothetical protein
VTSDSGRHAQRGDAKQAPSEGCQSGGAAASPESHPMSRSEEDTVELLREVLDKAQQVNDSWDSEDAWRQWEDVRARAEAALSKLSPLVQGGQ